MQIQNLVVCKKNFPWKNPVLVLAPFRTNILTPAPLLVFFLCLFFFFFFFFFFFLLFQNFVADK